MIKQTISIIVTLVAALVLSGCSDDKESKASVAAKQAPAKPEMLKYVPADAPYVFVSGKPFPRTLVEKMLKHSNEELDTFIASFDEMVAASAAKKAQAPAENTGSEPVPQLEVDSKFEDLVGAVLAELQGKLTPDGIESLGFSMQGQSLLYGLGVLPVMRIAVSDQARVEAMIGRIEARSGMQAEIKMLGSQSYRWFDLDNLVAIMALRDNQLILAILPANAETDTLPLVLGETLPTQSLAETDTFDRLYKDYGFSGFGDGYIDMVKLVGFILGEGSAENLMIREALEIDTGAVSPACENLAKSQVQAWPRMVMGFTNVSNNQYQLRGVLETSTGVADWLGKLAAPVPGLGQQDNALLAIGAGVNLPVYRDAVKAGMQSILLEGKGCEWVDEAEITKGMQTVDLMFNPMLAGIRGFYLSVNELELDPATMMPVKIAAKLLLAVDDPKGIFSMLGMVNHKFTQMQIPADGKPVALPMEDIAPGVPPTFVAIKDKALGFSVGKGAELSLPDFLTANLVIPSPLFHIGYDVAGVTKSIAPVLANVKQAMATAPDDDSNKVIIDGLDSFQASGDVYGQVSLQITASKRGLVFDQVVNLQ